MLFQDCDKGINTLTPALIGWKCAQDIVNVFYGIFALFISYFDFYFTE